MPHRPRAAPSPGTRARQSKTTPSLSARARTARLPPARVAARPIAGSKLDVDAALGELRAELARHGKPERALHEQRYLKSELEFLGVAVPHVRSVAKSFARARPELSRRQLRQLAEALFESRVHELRSVAIGILEQMGARLEPMDHLWLIALVRVSNTWAHVDWLATKVIGGLVERHPALGEQLERWSADRSFWVRRAALLALHDPLLRGRGDFQRFARLAAPLLSEREFFIRKAIGWVLRSTARRQPELTRAFVAAHAAEMSALTFKEATRLLPEVEQRRLRALREATTR